MRRRLAGLLLTQMWLIGPARAAETREDMLCAKLAISHRSALQILSTTRAPAGDFDAGEGRSIRVPASCRVVAVARPTSDSEIGFELWLPDGWNGRYTQLGNGGFAGNIDHPSLAAEIRRGNAAAMTDTGHKGSQFDASWALGHPEKVIDYGYRSIKVTADAARLLTAEYYGKALRRRYFIGCSNGGRQALMAAQRFPADWDGIIAGSPALRWTEQLAMFGAIQHRIRGNPANWIPAAKFPNVSRAARSACGEHVVTCHVDVRKLTCAGAARPDCLTHAEATTLALVQSDPVGFDPRFADVPQNWDQWIFNADLQASSQLTFATSAYRFLVHDDPNWRIDRFDRAHDQPLIQERRVGDRRLADILNADDPDLRAFAQRGGKLIIYVGTADAVVSPRAAMAYFSDAVHRIGVRRAARSLRLFPVPGMQHCQGGLTPNAFGQAWVAPALKADPRHDIRIALERWVERGRSPQFLIATSSRDASISSQASTRTIMAHHTEFGRGNSTSSRSSLPDHKRLPVGSPFSSIGGRSF